ncbi:MAG: YggS family pyridoxal phosphate-dependent enzyme [Flavobacteriaceae bacterium]|nr:YggS family pyridoxal phosphate-dependent enzyme [Flavobacteriaceae bacterium]
MQIKERLTQIISELPQDVTLVAVTKTMPVSVIQEAYQAGQRIFGENKVQEMVHKQPELPNDIEWHMIGHVQRNKVKYMASFVSLIHGVESLKLLKEIDKQARKQERIIDCLFQIKIAEEDSKFGMSVEGAVEILNSDIFKELKHINIKGVMGMATFTQNKEQIKREFDYLKSTYDQLSEFKSFNCNFEIISMGMSGDYQLAIDCGSTLVRIGSSIFGPRNYSV